MYNNVDPKQIPTGVELDMHLRPKRKKRLYGFLIVIAVIGLGFYYLLKLQWSILG